MTTGFDMIPCWLRKAAKGEPVRLYGAIFALVRSTGPRALTHAQIAEEANENVKWVRRHLSSLKEAGAIREDGVGGFASVYAVAHPKLSPGQWLETPLPGSGEGAHKWVPTSGETPYPEMGRVRGGKGGSGFSGNALEEEEREKRAREGGQCHEVMAERIALAGGTPCPFAYLPLFGQAVMAVLRSMPWTVEGIEKGLIWLRTDCQNPGNKAKALQWSYFSEPTGRKLIGLLEVVQAERMIRGAG